MIAGSKRVGVASKMHLCYLVQVVAVLLMLF